MPKSLPRNKRIVPISIASEMLGVSIDTVRRWDKKGLLHSERPDGKTRYFSVKELEKNKLSQPLPISKVSEKLNISPSTLRRLEKKGLLKPKRNKAGERVYPQEIMESFLDSEYFLRQKQVEDKILAPFKGEGSEKSEEPKPLVKTLAAMEEETKREVGRIGTLQKRISSVGLSLFILFIVLISMLVILFLVFPEDMSKAFGYRDAKTLALVKQSGKSVLGASTSQSSVSGFLKPFSRISIGIIKVVDGKTYKKIFPQEPITDINQVLVLDENGNIKPLIPIQLPSVDYLQVTNQSNSSEAPSTPLTSPLNIDLSNLAKIDSQGNIEALRVAGSNLTAGSVGTSKLADDAVSTLKIADGAVTSAKLAADVVLTVADNSITTEKIKNLTIKGEDIADGTIPDSKLAKITSSNKVEGSAIQLASGGGLANSSGLSLLRSCSNNQILKWDNPNSQWICATVSGVGSGVSSFNSLTGDLVVAGGGINTVSASGSTITVTAIEADTLASVTGRGASTSTALTFSGGVTLSAGNFDQSGSSGTFKTGTGAVSLSGDTTVAAGKAFVITGGAGSPTATTGIVWYDTTANKYKIVENGVVKTICNTTDAGCGTGGSAGVTSLDSLTGVLTIANSIGTSSTITINNAAADGSTKGIAAFNSTNFTASSGVVNTIQNIATTSTPTFASGTILGSQTFSTNNIADLGALTIASGGSGALTLNTASGTVTSNGTTLTLGGSATINGGTASGGTLILVSTTNVTKGDIQFFSSSNKITSAGALTVAGAVISSNISSGASVSGSNTGDQTNISGNAGTVTGLSVVSGKTLTVNKTMSFTAADDTGVYTLPTGTATLLGTTGSIAGLTGTISSSVLGNSTVFIGTTSIALNRTTASQALTGITSIDGSAATLTTPRAINGTNFDGSAAITVPVNNADDTTTNSTFYPLITATAGGNAAAKVSTTKLFFNPSTGLLTSTGFSGPLTGNVTGNVSGTSGGLSSQYIDWNASSGGTSIANKPTLGTISSQAANNVSITGGTISGLTGLAVRDTSAAFDVTIAAISGTTLTAGRTLTLDTGNVAHTLAFGTTANTITFPSAASYTLLATNGSIAGLTGTITSSVLGNSTVFIGTTAIALNRGTGSQSLTGINIDGTAATVTGAAQSAITSVGSLVSGTVIATQTFSTNNILDSGALTIKSGGTSALTLDTAGSAAINIGNTNATSLVFGNTTSNPTFAFNGSGTFATSTGAHTLNGDITIAANKLLTFAAGTGTENVTINAGSTGTTASLIVKLDTSGTVVTTDTTTLNNAVGVSLDTKSSGQAVRVAVHGVITAVADNAVTAGDYIGVGTGTAGRAKSLGTTYPTTAGIQVIGRATSTQASAGSTFTLLLEGLDNNVAAGAACATCVVTNPAATATNTITPTSTNIVGLTVNGVSSQSVDMFDVVQTAAGTNLISVTSTGAINLTSVASGTWQTSGTGSNLIVRSGANTATTALILDTNAIAGGTGGVTVTTGAASSGATGSLNLSTGNAGAGAAGNINIDVGTSSAGNGSIKIGGAARIQTIEIGKGTAGNTISIGTDNTTADTISIGSALDSLAFSSAHFAVTAAGAVSGVTTLSTSGAINKVTLTAPASGATLTIIDGKTLTVNKTMSFTAADDTGVYTLPTGTATLLGTTGSIAGLTGTISSSVLGNSTVFIGTTSIALNRTTASQALTGITSIDGSAATLTTPRAINGTNFDGSAAITVPVNNADDTTTNSTFYPLITATAGGNAAAKVSTTKLFFNPSTGLLTSTGFSGPLTGNVTGNVSGTAATVTGAAQSAITSVGSLVSGTVIASQTFSTNAISDSGALTITSATASNLTLGAAGTTGTLTLGLSTDTNTISIGAGATADTKIQTINIGTGTGVTTGKAVITIGETNGASSLTLKAGTGDINFYSTSNKITSSGALTVASTITAATTGTINGINVSSSAVSGVTTLGLSGAITGATATNTINGIVINSGAVSSVSTLGLSGAITGATATNTINGLIINGSTQTLAADGITFAAGTGSHNVTLTAGTGGTTAGLIVIPDTTASQVITATTGTLNNAVGVAVNSVSGGAAAKIAISGVVSAVADNVIAVGDYIGIGTTTAGRAKSLGSTYPTTANIQVLGRALTAQASAGSTFNLLLSALDNNVSAGAACTTCIVQIPTGNTANTANNNVISPTAGSVKGLTINGTTDATTAADILNLISGVNTGLTSTNGILFNQNSAGTTTNGLNITQTTGTLISGISFSGTIGTDITTASGRVLSIDSGTTGGINIGTSANAKTLTLGNTTAQTNVIINAGVTTNNTAGLAVNANGATTDTAGAVGISATGLTTGTGLALTVSDPKVNASGATNAKLSTGKIISVVATDGKNYLSLDNRDLTVGGHTNQVTVTNVNDIYVYDTTRDLDGGRWTQDERAKQASWYNETRTAADACTIGTNLRCGAQVFPKKAILVVTASGTTKNLLIFDAKDNSLWMEFDASGAQVALGSSSTTVNTLSSVFALNGNIYVGTNGTTPTGMYEINFKNDKITRYNTTDAEDYSGAISSRNTTQTAAYNSQGRTAMAILSASVNDVFAQPINGKTFVAVATAGGTNGGISLINETSQSVANLGTASKAYTAAWYSPDDNVYGLNSTDKELDVWYQASTKSGNTVAFSAMYDETGTSATSGTGVLGPALFSAAPTINASAPDALYVTNGTSTVDGQSNTIYVAYNEGLTVLQEKTGNETAGSVKYYSSNNISEEMIGDTRAMLPMAGNTTLNNALISNASDKDVSIKAVGFTSKGTTNVTSVSGVRGLAKNFDGTANYLCTGTVANTCADNTNLSIATNTFALSFWIKTTSAVTTRTIVNKQVTSSPTAGSAGYYVGITTGHLLTANVTDGTTAITATSTRILDDNLWHHVVISENRLINNSACNAAGNSCTLTQYIDGVQDGQSAANTTQSGSMTNTNFMTLMANSAATAAQFTGGVLDEFSFFANSISAAQVQKMYQVGYRALFSSNNGSGTFHSAQTIRGVTVAADASQALNGSSVVKAVRPMMDNGLIYTGGAAGVSVIGIDNDTLQDLYSTSITTKDDVNAAYDATNGNAVVSVSNTKGYGTGTLLAIGQNNSGAGGIWAESNDTTFKDFLATSYDPFGMTFTQTNLSVDRVLRVSNQGGSRLDNLTITGTTQPIVPDIFRVDNNGVAVSVPTEALYTNGTNTIAGVTISAMNNITMNGGTAVTFNGISTTTPNITGTSGTPTANGENITVGTVTTAGTNDGIKITLPTGSGSITTAGTISGIELPTVAAGPGAGSLNGIKIGSITTPGAGTETGLNIGSGWDTAIGVTDSQAVANTLVNITTSNTGQTGNSLLTQTASTATVTNGLVRFNFNGIRTTAGNGFQIDDVSTTLATAMQVNVNSLTTGLGLSVINTGTGLTTAGVNTGSLLNINSSGATTAFTGSLANINFAGTAVANTGALLNINASGTSQITQPILVTDASTGATTNGMVRFNFTGARTAAGNGFQIDDISTTLATTMKINTNSLTTGNGLVVSATAAGLTGNALSVTTGSTGAPTAGLVRFNFNGIRTAAGVGFQIDDISTTLATAMQLNANSLTSGLGFTIASSATGITTAGTNVGSLLNVNETGAMTGMTGQLVSINASGANAVGSTGSALNINLAGTAQLMKGITVTSATTGVTTDMMTMTYGGIATLATTNKFIRFINSGAATQGQISGTGTTGQVVYTTTSDLRLKHNVTDTHFGLTDLMNLHVRDYIFNADTTNTIQTGFVAQELNGIYPEAVATNGDDGMVSLSNDAIPWSVDYGKVTPLLVKAIQDQQVLVVGLQTSIAALRELKQSTSSAGLNNQITQASSSAQISTSSAQLAQKIIFDNDFVKVLGSLTVDKSAIVSLDLSVLGKLTATGGLTVFGPAEFKDKTIFDSIAEFFGNVIFHKDVAFEGRPTFNNDTAGFAIVKKDAESVDIVFDKEYTQTPLVNISVTIDDNVNGSADPAVLAAQTKLESDILNGDIKYVVTRRNTRGFTIKINKPAVGDIKFSWTAFAIKDAKTAVSSAVLSTQTSTPTPTATPIATPVPTVVPTPTPLVSASPTPTPTPTPSATPVASVQSASQTLTVNQNDLGFLRVRDIPAASGSELAQVNPGQTFEIKGTDNGWYKIEYSTGAFGWVSGSYVTLN